MGYRLIQGTFKLYDQGQRHVGSQPDGDSVWFEPDQPDLLRNRGGPVAFVYAGSSPRNRRGEKLGYQRLHSPYGRLMYRVDAVGQTAH